MAPFICISSARLSFLIFLLKLTSVLSIGMKLKNLSKINKNIFKFNKLILWGCFGGWCVAFLEANYPYARGLQMLANITL